MYFEIWSKPNCFYCDKAKELLKTNKLEYQEFIFTDGELLPNQTRVTREQVLERTPTARTFPQIYLHDNGETYIGGCNEFEKWLKNFILNIGKLKTTT